MPYCPKCGSVLEDDAAFCGICGASVAKTQAQAAAQSQTQAAAPQYNAPAQPAKVQPAPEMPTDEQADIAENKVYAALSYFGPLVLVPIFASPKSKFARFHANQGLLLCCVYVAEIIVTILLNLIKVTKYYFGIPYRATPVLITILCTLLWLGAVALAVLGAINAGTGKYKKLPVIGEIFTFLK